MNHHLVLRRATTQEAGRLAEFNALIHGDVPSERPGLEAWTRDLLSGQHPTTSPQDFTFIEDTTDGKIVSCMVLINQTWAFEGIPFGVGRPELVGTLPEFRRQGLVRRQFEEAHRLSASGGQLMQVITGIPNYYRQFGYEMAVNLMNGLVGPFSLVPNLPEGQVEPYLIRPACESDLAFIARLYEQGCRRSVLSCIYTPELWLYELSGKSPQNINRTSLHIITDSKGERLGFVGIPVNLWGSTIIVSEYELEAGVSWLDITPSVFRFARATGEAYATRLGRPYTSYNFCLGVQHPVYQVCSHRFPSVPLPYAYYIRIPDLPAFIQVITPALERRLVDSVCCSYSGNLKLSFYRSGLNLTFERGRLIGLTGLKATELEKCGAAFPGLTFLQLLLGYRSLDELKYAYPDCWVNDDAARPLLNSLFPRRPSDLLPIS